MQADSAMAVSRLAGMAGRTLKTDAVVLRSMRYGEADRILHLYSAQRGRIGAIAKGVRKTTSRFGARLEPLSHVELLLHEGGGELHTITGVALVKSHRATREEPYRLNAGLIGAEAMLRLFGEPEANERAFGALTRYLDLLDVAPVAASRPSLDPLALSFQLKLLWLAGYLPHLNSCVECGAGADLVAYSARSGGAVCQQHASGALRLTPEGIAAIEELLSTPLADAVGSPLSDRARRDALAVVMSSYEEHGGFRMRTLSA
jgi:DNA repair protein RecO (recombination protein O)